MTQLLTRPEPPVAAVRALLAEAQQHQAARHAFLGRFAGAAFHDQERVARQLVSDYAGFAAWELRFTMALLERLPSPAHRGALLRQLAAAHGLLDADDEAALARAGIAAAPLRAVSRPELFRRLCGALDVEPWKMQRPQPAAQRWRTALLQLVREAPLVESIGALLGVLAVAGRIGDQLAIGLQQLGSLHRADAVYFELPSLLGGRDLDELRALAAASASKAADIEGLRRGLRAALDLVAAFWDQQYAGALARRLANPA
ncbi:MAG: hypothetical protein H6835_08270 [Planctomycetes bacterium]|nr:hypothetical protein [Planctomycetota bacterium]